jgi:hypothetical protein
MTRYSKFCFMAQCRNGVDLIDHVT